MHLGCAPAARVSQTTALDVWQTEVARSYNCMEHFIVRTGRGAGRHHFGGLSAPVLSRFGAYHRAGRLTVGSTRGLNPSMWRRMLLRAPGAGGHRGTGGWRAHRDLAGGGRAWSGALPGHAGDPTAAGPVGGRAADQPGLDSTSPHPRRSHPKERIPSLDRGEGIRLSM